MHDPLAQPVEHLTFNQRARGSSPRRVTKKEAPPHGGASFFAVATRPNPRKCEAFSQVLPVEGGTSRNGGQNRGSESPTKSSPPYERGNHLVSVFSFWTPYVDRKTKNGLNTRRTLHADVTTAESGSNAQPNTTVAQNAGGVNICPMQNDAVDMLGIGFCL